MALEGRAQAEAALDAELDDSADTIRRLEAKARAPFLYRVAALHRNCCASSCAALCVRGVDVAGLPEWLRDMPTPESCTLRITGCDAHCCG